MEIVPENLALKKAKLEDVDMPHAARLIFEYKINPGDVIGNNLKCEIEQSLESATKNHDDESRPVSNFEWLNYGIPRTSWYMSAAALNYQILTEFECTKCHNRYISRSKDLIIEDIQSTICNNCKLPFIATIRGFHYPLTYGPFFFYEERRAIKHRVADLLWKAHLRRESPYLSILPRDIFIKILAFCGLRKCQIDAPYSTGM